MFIFLALAQLAYRTEATAAFQITDEKSEPISFEFGNREKTGAIPAPPPSECVPGETKYVFSSEDNGCEPVALAVRFTVVSTENIDLYLRLNRRVEVEGGRIVADLVSESPATGEDIFMTAFDSGTLPLQPGRYFVAVSI